MTGLNIGNHPFASENYKNWHYLPLQGSYPTSSSDTHDNPEGSDAMAGASAECQDDLDCERDAGCVDVGAGVKQCFCYEKGVICPARSRPKGKNKGGKKPHGKSADQFKTTQIPSHLHPAASLCGNDCGPYAVCHPREGCICFNTWKLQVNGSCPEEGGPSALTSTTPVDNLNNDVVHRDQITKIINSTSTNQTNSLTLPSHTASTGQSVLLYVVLPLGILLFLGFLIVIICLRRQRQHRLGPTRASEAVVKSGDGVMLLDRMNNINKNPTYFVSPGDDDDPTQRKFMVREICMDHIVLVDVVGEGAFGQVYRGEMHCPETNTQQLVAVKVLKENVSNEIREDFEREVEIMSAFDHDNILKLVGVVTQNAGQSPYMIFEYMVHGDLAELLRKNDAVMLKKDSSVIRLQKPDLVDIATQIANGMRYLTSQHFVHRDLATRNCLVGEGLVVKISDFGMSRDIYTCDYYKIGGSRMLPVRWMSPESVKYGRFTSESDAWAYGVVLWEIFSFGRQPYYGHSNEEVVRFLDAGILLQRPEDCPSTIYHIMLGCWKADPKERLTFDKIHKHLQDYHGRLVKMAAASQPTTPVANEDEIQMKIPEVASSPELPTKQQQSPASLAPFSKPLLKATQSDPQAGTGKAVTPLVEASRTTSQTLTQNNLQSKPQELAGCQDVIFQVKLPPLQSTPPSSASMPKSCLESQPDVPDTTVKPDSSSPTKTPSHSSSLIKLHAMDSGFSSGEQQWNVPEIVESTTEAMAKPSSPVNSSTPSDIVLEPLTSIVCTNPPEVV